MNAKDTLIATETAKGKTQLLWVGKVPFIKDGKRIYLDVKDTDAYIDRAKRQFSY